ncbi:DUF2138 family protein [Rhodanobacter sp. L36]|uniref:DUF2138 family protein n=1 Tax=Rhodanobacter sp. L36 TaxID=1747221 RepID=UPI00131CD034|nr:DUF2138 family protein [Rhodanobacter sp. L36]
MTLANHKTLLLSGLLLLGLSAAAITVQAIWRPLAPHAHVAAQLADIDLAQPDALIRSERLSALPRDLLRVPLLHEVLSEDFVSYYEFNEGRLSLSGTLRRIAYEHQLDLGDEVIRQALDAPAEVALWHGDHGKLQYWLLLGQRNGLTRLLQGIANVALDDSQLKNVGKLEVDGDKVALYALAYGYQRNLLFAVHGDRLVVLSDPGMLLNENGTLDDERSEQIIALLDGSSKKPAWPDSALAKDSDNPRLDKIKGHQLSVSAHFLSFGYQPFFPGIEALRFDFSADAEHAWDTRALVNPALLPEQWNSASLWQVLPTDPAACVSLPVDWASAGHVLDAVMGKDAAGIVLPAFSGPAAICWYGKSRLSSPLFVARFDKPELVASMKPSLEKAFTQIIGAYEEKAGNADGRLPVTSHQGVGDSTEWQRDVSARYGSADATEAKLTDTISSDRYFPVTLAVAHGYVVFSPDGALVDDALAVLEKRWPAVADSMGNASREHVVAQLTPASMAKLIEQESFASLPQDQEPVFRNAATQFLIPKLHALGAYPALTLRLPDTLPTQRGWIAVQWQSAAVGSAH